jgi:YD repeat-containing protein
MRLRITVIATCSFLVIGRLDATTNYFYDSLNRLTRVTYSDGTAIVYTYDSVGNRLSQVITNPAVSQPAVGVDKTTLPFSALAGQASTPQTVAVSNTGGGNLQWNAVATASWLSVAPPSGTNSGAFSVTASAAGLSAGIYNASVMILASASNAPVTIPVTFAVAPGCNYGVNPGGEAFSAAGGSGTISVTAGTGCAWMISNNLNWVTFGSAMSGSGNGTVNFQVAANTTAARSGSLGVAGLAFALEQQSSSSAGLNFVGSMAQMSSAGGWDTTITLVNGGTSEANARLSFFDNSGNPLGLPLAFPQLPPATGSLLAPTLDRTLSANAQVVMESTGPDNAATLVGAGQLLSNGSVNGFGIYSNPTAHWNAVVPLETRDADRYILAFDNTGTLTTGVAVANLAAQEANVQVIIRDDTGAQIGNPTIPLGSLGHTSFMLNDPQLGFPVTNSSRGTVEFDTPPGGKLSVLGLRANGPALTTLPVLANVGTSGGSITHVAYNGFWTSVFYLVNTSNASASFTLSFFDESGIPLPVPLSLPQLGTNLTTPALTRTLSPGAMLVVETQAQDALPVVVGSAQLTTAGNVSGFEIFRWTQFGQEASVPLETRTPNSFVLVFDDTNGLTTGVALANLSSTSANIIATFRDDTGTQIGLPETINLAASGHSDFMLPDRYQEAVAKRGMVEFAVPQGIGISVIGLRAKSDGTLTTIPVLTK